MVIGCLLLCVVLLLASAAGQPAPRPVRDEEANGLQATYPPIPPRPSGRPPRRPLTFFGIHFRASQKCGQALEPANAVGAGRNLPSGSLKRNGAGPKPCALKT
jgi:hypothetical protein